MTIGVARDNQANYNYPTGIGYVVLPDGLDRNDYITQCYRRERVSILLDNGGGFVKDCYIDRNRLQEIEFPISPNQVGSCVVFVNERFNNKPFIVGVISKEDESQFLEENMFQKQVGFQNNNVNIIGKGQNGELLIDIESEVEDGGVFVLNVRNSNKNARLEINCFGDTTIYNEGNTTIRATENINAQTIKIENENETVTSSLSLNNNTGLRYFDMWENQIIADNEGNVVVIGKNVKLNNGNSPLTKGDLLQIELNKTKGRIDRIISAINSAQTGSSDGGLLYKQNLVAALNQITSDDVENFSEINSNTVFTD